MSYTLSPSAQEKFDAVLQKCLEFWPGKSGEELRDRVKGILERIIVEWPKKLGGTGEELFLKAESARTYSVPNYYQDCNFPELSDDIAVFEDREDFLRKFPSRIFICPSCGGESTDPQECNSGVKKKDIKDGKTRVCNWKAYGLFKCLGKGYRLVLKKDFSGKIIEIFRPKELEKE